MPSVLGGVRRERGEPMRQDERGVRELRAAEGAVQRRARYRSLPELPVRQPGARVGRRGARVRGDEGLHGNGAHALPHPPLACVFLKSPAVTLNFIGCRQVMSIGDVKGDDARTSWRLFYEKTVLGSSCGHAPKILKVHGCSKRESTFFPTMIAVSDQPCSPAGTDGGATAGGADCGSVALLQGVAEPLWNFQGKFLVDKEGGVSVAPKDPEEAASVIARLIAK